MGYVWILWLPLRDLKDAVESLVALGSRVCLTTTTLGCLPLSRRSLVFVGPISFDALKLICRFLPITQSLSWMVRGQIVFLSFREGDLEFDRVLSSFVVSGLGTLGLGFRV